MSIVVEPNPRQSQIIHMKTRGHFVVLGTAGTGKSLMAVLRALALSADGTRRLGGTPDRVLVVTFNNALKGYLDHLVEVYGDRVDGHDVHVVTYHAMMRGVLRQRGHRAHVCHPDTRKVFITRSIAALATSGSAPIDRPVEFFADEFDWIDGNGIDTVDDYRTAARTGRVVALGRGQREYVWALRDEYRRSRAKANYDLDWAGIAPAVRREFAARPLDPLWDHVIVDEGQDLRPEEVRSLVDVTAPHGSFTMFGDYAQRLYGGQLSWKSCGINIAGRPVERFVDNFRNTAPIARFAAAISSHPLFNDSEDIVQPRLPNVDGSPPTVTCFDAQAVELDFVIGAARREGGRRVAILTHTNEQTKEMLARLDGTGHRLKDATTWRNPSGIWCGTYHSAKGLEFDTVYLPWWGVKDAPPLDESDTPDDVIARELKKLYVGVTRANTALHLSYSGDLSPLIPADRTLYTWTDGSGDR